MPLPQSTMSARLYCHWGGVSSTGSFDMSFTLITTGCTLTDQGIAASSGSLGPGNTREAVCASAGAWSKVLLTQPRAHGLWPTLHFLALPAAAKKLEPLPLASWLHGHLSCFRQEL